MDGYGTCRMGSAASCGHDSAFVTLTRPIDKRVSAADPLSLRNAAAKEKSRRRSVGQAVSR
jgi:hypothetical protein